MGKFEDELIFEVDFNDRDGDGRLVASLSFASSFRKPEVGEEVVAHDDEGNRCAGTVVAVKNTIAFIDLDRSTWTRLTVVDSPGTVKPSVSISGGQRDRREQFELVG